MKTKIILPPVVAFVALALPATSHASARTVTVQLANRTDQTLMIASQGLDHGTWKALPAPRIVPGVTTWWESDSNGFMTGTAGSVVYALSTGGQIRIRWDNPYVGANSYEQSAPTGYELRLIGGSGTDARPEFTLRRIDLTILPTLPVDRLRVRVATSADQLAGTDNDVYFDVGPLGWQLDTPHYNDFERGSVQTYELAVPQGTTTDDIAWLRLQKKGDGGYWGVTDAPEGNWKPEALTVSVLSRGRWVSFVSANIDQWLDTAHPIWSRDVRGYVGAERFVRTLRLQPNRPLTLFSETVALLTTNLGKNLGISGWLGTDVPLTCATGRVIRQPRLSSDGLATIDLMLESIDVGGADFVLDGRHRIRGTRYIRVEFLAFPNGLDRVPRDNDRTRICGRVRWDTDYEGWYEIHPRGLADVVILDHRRAR